MSRRLEEIENALAKLQEFKKDPAYAHKQYAIDANIAFLKAARSFPRYLWWLATVAPNLDGSKLLELTDFPVEEWDIKMHKRLIEMQKKKQPGLVAPLVKAISDYIRKENRALVLADLGAGGMEVDRQVIAWALKSKLQQPLTIVAVDKSPITRKIAFENLKELAGEITLVETGDIRAADLEKMRASSKNILVVMCTNNIFGLEEQFSPKYFDLVYHSLFRHHLSVPEQGRLDATVTKMGKRHFEFDGFMNWPVVIPQTIVGWRSPHFLNGELFSNFRFKRRQYIARNAALQGALSFYGMTGFYLLTYSQPT